MSLHRKPLYPKLPKITSRAYEWEDCLLPPPPIQTEDRTVTAKNKSTTEQIHVEQIREESVGPARLKAQ